MLFSASAFFFKFHFISKNKNKKLSQTFYFRSISDSDLFTTEQFHLTTQTDADGHNIVLVKCFRNRAKTIEISNKMLLIAAVMTVTVAISFVAIDAPAVTIVATGKVNIGCTTNCLTAKLCCIAAGCSPTKR